MVKKELGERNFGFDSLKSRLKRDMEEKAMFSVDSCQFTSGPYNFSDAPLFRPLGRMWTPRAALPAEESAYDREVGTKERQRNYMDPK